MNVSFVNFLHGSGEALVPLCGEKSLMASAPWAICVDSAISEAVTMSQSLLSLV